MSSTVESNVRSYCRNFPIQFDKASGVTIFSSDGTPYLDFLSGCGALNYGHNCPELKAALLAYIEAGGITMSMDMHTASKSDFMEAFSTQILAPRGLSYKMQFTGPTGANAVEAAIKLARKVTGRTNIIAFTNGFHGCSLGALALTANSHHRNCSTALLTNVTRLPYDGYWPGGLDTSDYLEQLLDDPSGGCDKPAAIILETIQGEGGLNTASVKWAKKVEAIAKKNNALLIVDDIQAGCGRTGTFFSFERLGISPDLVTMAKSLSGFGLPLSLVLLKPGLDEWLPGEHNGTFRGHNLAFVTATAAIRQFWSDDQFQRSLAAKTSFLSDVLNRVAGRFGFSTKGRGFFQGIDVGNGITADDTRHNCFDAGLIIETCGPFGEIVKLLPALTISESDLFDGIMRIEASLEKALLTGFSATA